MKYCFEMFKKKFKQVLSSYFCGCLDPFFPLSFLVNSWFPGTLDAFFQALFLCALLLFWLCVYHGIRVQVGALHPSLIHIFSFFFFIEYLLYFSSLGREEIPHILPAQVDYRRSSVALSGHTWHMANVSVAYKFDSNCNSNQDRKDLCWNFQG